MITNEIIPVPMANRMMLTNAFAGLERIFDRLNLSIFIVSEINYG